MDIKLAATEPLGRSKVRGLPVGRTTAEEVTQTFLLPQKKLNFESRRGKSQGIKCYPPPPILSLEQDSSIFLFFSFHRISVPCHCVINFLSEECNFHLCDDLGNKASLTHKDPLCSSPCSRVTRNAPFPVVQTGNEDVLTEPHLLTVDSLGAHGKFRLRTAALGCCWDSGF